MGLPFRGWDDIERWLWAMSIFHGLGWPEPVLRIEAVVEVILGPCRYIEFHSTEYYVRPFSNIIFIVYQPQSPFYANKSRLLLLQVAAIH